MKFKGFSKSKAAGVLGLLAFGGLMYIMNRAVPKIADDYPFSFIWDGKNHGNLTAGKKRYRRVKNLKELVYSQATHYMTWSGRIIGESMNQAVLMKDDKKLYDVLNTGVSLLWLLLCIRGGRGRKALSGLNLPLAALMGAGYFLSTPHFAATSMWTTGAMNYSWPGIFQYAYLLPYAFKYRDPEYTLNRALMALLGLLAGWSNEAGGGAALALSAAATLRSMKRGEDTGFMICGLATAFAGYALLMLAPGNFRRYKWEIEFSDVIPEDLSDPGIVPLKYNYTPVMFKHHFKNGFLSTLKGTLPMQLPVLFYFLNNKEMNSDTTRYILLLEGAALLVPSVLMLSPQFPVRAAFLSGPFAMSAAAAAFEGRVTGDPASPVEAVKTISYIALGVSAAVRYAAALIADADLYIRTREQERIMRETPENETAHIPEIMISPFYLKIAGDRTIDEYIKWYIGYEENPDGPYNRSAAAYYGVKEVVAYEPENHPYKKKDKASLKEQILRPLRSFIKRFFGDLRE